MLRSGTTTLEAKSGYGLDRDTELKMLRVIRRLNDEGPARIIPTLLAAHTVPPEYKDRRADYVRFVAEELIPEVANLGLAQYCDAFCDDHAFTVDESRTVLTAARRSTASDSASMLSNSDQEPAPTSPQNSAPQPPITSKPSTDEDLSTISAPPALSPSCSPAPSSP